MKITQNKKSDSWTISGLSWEQLNILSFLVQKAQDYSGEQEQEASFGDGYDYLDITEVGCIPFTEEEIKTLHTIKL